MVDKRPYMYTPDYAVPPGETLAELLHSLGMTQHDLAVRSGRPVKTINEIIKGKARITPQTALQFERIFRMPASFWDNLERNYQETLARIAEHQNLQKQIAWLDKIPVRAMTKLGWISDSEDKVEQLRITLNFFGVASPEQWEAVWSSRQAAFRQSLAFRSHPGAVAAWLRKGELIAQEIKCQPYSQTAFRSTLYDVRKLTVANVDIFIPQLQTLCAESGVAFIFLQELPGMRISGATRWLSPGKALIQLTLRYKTNDHLWFTLFHETGHILFDGKRDVFIEDSSISDESEDRADCFARDILIPPSAYKQFCKAGDFSLTTVQSFSTENNVAPGIVVGRLQHDRIIPFNSRLNRLKVHYQWPS